MTEENVRDHGRVGIVVKKIKMPGGEDVMQITFLLVSLWVSAPL